MFSFGYLLAAAAAIVAAAAMPYVSPRSLDINAMMNRTVCAIRVHYNNDSNRIPYRIKEIKCAEQTDQWCTENKIPHQECCHHTQNKQLMECAEMTDKVQVFYKSSNVSTWLDVAVGCSCVIERSTTASHPPGLK